MSSALSSEIAFDDDDAGNNNATLGSTGTTNFEVVLTKETFKFNAAHFIVYPGFRERLHGHNYKVGVRFQGSERIGNDGYLIDFGDVKTVVRELCKELDEQFLCPMLSDNMAVTVTDEDDREEKKNADGTRTTASKPTGSSLRGTVCLACEDGSRFSIPRMDCVLLPIVHSTVEELSIYIWGNILRRLDVKILRDRGIHTLEISCQETPGQEAVFRRQLPWTNDEEEISRICDVRKYISKRCKTPCVKRVRAQDSKRKR